MFCRINLFNLLAQILMMIHIFFFALHYEGQNVGYKLKKTYSLSSKTILLFFAAFSGCES